MSDIFYALFTFLLVGVFFTCQLRARGSAIEWTENGSVLSGEDGTTLNVAKTVSNSGKTYGCRAHNDLDTTGKSDSVTIDVRGEP